jgi:hypothetical protein
MAGVDYKGFEAGDQTRIWRYMPVDRYAELLAGQLYFPAATQFDDRFEGAITEAQIARRRELSVSLADDVALERELQGTSEAFADLRRLTKISCWHARPHENVAMWERYRPADGLAVAVTSSVGALKASLRPFRLREDYGEEAIRVGAARYIDYAHEDMADRSMEGVFLHKRVEYADEREVRALLSLRMPAEFGVPIPDKGAVVGVRPGTLIHEVRVDARAASAEVSGVVDLTRAAGVAASVTRSTLGADPVY